MMKSLITFLSAAFFSVNLLAQDDGLENSQRKNPGPYNLADHLAFGGNMGLTFGTYTNIDLNPVVGYRVSEKFIPGIGLFYSYTHVRASGYYPEFSTYFYGGSVFARYYVLPQLFLHAECQEINGEWDPYIQPGERYFLPAYFVGGGYRESMGNISSYILFLYNLNNKTDSPYDNPFVIRVGFGVGL